MPVTLCHQPRCTSWRQSSPRQPDAILLYADEDEMDGSGRRGAARFKSDWSPDLVLMGDAAGQPALYRTERLRAIGGLQANAAPFHRHDLLLRATEGVSPGLIRHVPANCLHRGRARLDRPAPFPGDLGRATVGPGDGDASSRAGQRGRAALC